MTNNIINYKKIRTDIINGKKRCIYIKLKGKREYVKSKGEFVLLSVYIKKMQKKYKNKGGEGDTRSKMPPHSKMKDPFDIYYEKQSNIRGNILNTRRDNQQSKIITNFKKIKKTITNMNFFRTKQNKPPKHI